MYCTKCGHNITHPYTILSEVEGTVNYIEEQGHKKYMITISTIDGKEVSYHTLSNSVLAVKVGSVVSKGQPLTKGKKDIDKAVLISEIYGEVTDINEVDDVYQITISSKAEKKEYVVPNGIKPIVSELNVVKEGTIIAKEQSFTKKNKVYSPLAGALIANIIDDKLVVEINSIDNEETFFVPFSFRQTINLNDEVFTGQLIARNYKNSKDNIFAPFSGKITSIKMTEGGYVLTLTSFQDNKKLELPVDALLEKNIHLGSDPIFVEKGQKICTYEETFKCEQITSELPGKVVSILPDENGNKVVTIESSNESKTYETSNLSTLTVSVGDKVHVGTPLIEKNERERMGEDFHCPYCGHKVILHELDHDEMREFNKSLHNRFNVSREKVDNALVKIVLGSTLLIVGILFFILSFKLPNVASPEKVLTITCFEFWVSMFGLGVGGALLIIGLISLIYQKIFVQTEINKTLNDVQYGLYVHID